MKIETIKIGKAGAYLKCYIHDDLVALGEGGVYREKRPAMLVFPGGAYRFCSYREADPVALKYFALGYETFTLFYSCKEEILKSHPLDEAVEAMRYIRSLKTVDQKMVCGIGFSAGAHLLGSVACHGREYGDNINFNAIIMSYPVVTAGEYTHPESLDNVSGHDKSRYDYFSLEKQVPPDFPPCFIWSTTDDATVPIENSLLLYNAVRKQHIPVEMHIYETGLHGASIANNETGVPNERVSHWFNEAKIFLDKTLGISDFTL